MSSLDSSAYADIAARVVARLADADLPNPTTLPSVAAAPTPSKSTAKPTSTVAANSQNAESSGCDCKPGAGKAGVYGCAQGATKAARAAFEQLEKAGFEAREKVCHIVKTLCTKNAKEWGHFEFQETKIGRLSAKAEKLQLVPKVPGVEWLRNPRASTGDEGSTLDIAAPYGVVAGILPVTHSVPTLSGNVVNAIAAGNAIVFNPHPGGAKSAALAVNAFNEAIKAELGIENLITTIEEPTIESFEDLCSSELVDIMCITGGPAVVNAALRSGKRSICAGPGNPPVIIDETADMQRAAESVLAGGGFDNNLLCIGEKQAFVTAGAWEPFIHALKQAGAVQLTNPQLQALTAEAFTESKDAGGCAQAVMNRDLIGADASKLAALAGVQIGDEVPMIFAETNADHWYVQKEQMMPMLPLVRCRDFDEALELALDSEHGYHHSAIMHSSSIERISQAGRKLNTTIFVANGPSTAGLGLGGEGYLSYSIATTTGEGITTPATFTRARRVTMSGGLRLFGA